MADKSSQLLNEALHRAAAEPQGVPLIAGKSRAGLFASNAIGKQAAEKAREAGLLRVLRTEARGKQTCEICGITEKGLAHLLAQVGTRPVLEDFVRALEARRQETGALLDAAKNIQANLESLKGTVERVLRQSGKAADKPVGAAVSANGSSTWKPFVLSYLGQWRSGSALEDCPIPELYRKALQSKADLTVGQFHDGLRSLHEQEQIYLHPWTGPLYEIPEPAYALLVGHEIAYYVSLRDRGSR
jgi:hypothetical protein